MRHRLIVTVTVTTAAVVLAFAAACRPGAHLSGGAPPIGSTAAGAVPIGTSTGTLEVGGVTRTYRLYRPARLADPAPLVLFLHGGYGNGAQAERSYGWDTQADTAGFLVAYPDGVDRAWNTGGGCCCIPERTGVDDVGFLTALVARLETEVPTDPARVYATGISNGGIMAYTLACQTSILAAIGPDSATQLGSCPHPAPISVIHIHGTADTRIPYGGGTGIGSAHIDGPGVVTLNASWRAVDGCAAPTIDTAGPVATSVAACPAGHTVELITITGAGHQWPGGVANPVLERLLDLDPPSTALNATATIWAFFAAHPRS